MARRSKAPKKRGRQPKDTLWQHAPRNGVDLALGNANAFSDKIFDQLPPKAGATYHYWCDRYDEAATNKVRFVRVGGAIRAAARTERVAKRYANEKTSKHFGCDVKTVRNRIKALRAASERVWVWQHENVFPRMEQYNEDVRRLTRAMTLLQHPAYADLERLPGVKAGGNSCRHLLTDPMYSNLEPTLLDPRLLAQFQSAEGAKLDSLQRLASALGAAFARAHAARVAAERRAAAAEQCAETAERGSKSLRQRMEADRAVPGFSAKRK